MKLFDYLIMLHYTKDDWFSIQTNIGRYQYQLKYVDEALFQLTTNSPYKIKDIVSIRTNTSYKDFLTEVLDEMQQRYFFIILKQKT